ncbi:MAG: sugar diacid recognition domain-containing protein [Pygmaiobacter sp.]
MDASGKAGTDVNLSKQNAMRIVTEISGIINQHVNMMDEQGMIIASTDPQRMGTFHGGSLRVIAENLEELIVWEDSQYEGAKKGINLPIRFDGEIVGVVGVTGEYDEVVKYGQILKKMTEILLRENDAADQKKIDDRIRARFLDDWLFEDSVYYSQQMIERGARLGIDITIPRRVLVAEITDLKNFSDSPEGQRMIDNVNKTVRRMMEQSLNHVFTKTVSQMICLIPDCENRRMRTIAEEIETGVQHKFGVSVMIGIDSRCQVLHNAYLKARKALRACAFSQSGLIFSYDDISLEIFMDEISSASKEEFLNRMFRGFSDEERTSWIHLLQAYFNANGSIGKAAEQLFIHKNTLQYKLRKLSEQTGYDPRKLSDAALYYLAVQFNGEKQEESSTAI